ncbi:MAG: quinone oxidoreductase [Deltaproteobacteria bacterium]|nr:quinone oxidoreductase [Deltaproteobacteria bacterium]
MTITARAIRLHTPGGPEKLRLEDIELAPLARGEARVRHTAIGVNFIDTYHRTGLYALPLPSGIGMEAAGVVEAIGEGVTEVAIGDRVAYSTAGVGAYATHRNVVAARLVTLPESVSDEAAAGALLKGTTVEALIHRVFRVEKGMTVLWHAAAGGVGLLACQWLSALGVNVIGTVSTEAKAALAKQNGCTHVIVGKDADFVAKVKELAPGKLPVVYDSVGKDTLLRSLDCLAPRGLLVSFGNASGKPDPLELLLLSQKGSLYVTRPTVATYTASREDLELSTRTLFDAIGKGWVRPDVRHRYPLADAKEAHRALQARETSGSIVLVP